MSKFDELKKVCEATQLGNVDFTINSTQILELIAIQAQMVEALRDMRSGWRYIRESYGDLYGVGWDRAEQKADAALSAAGVQP